VRVGYFDCFSGIAGDMTLAALVDAGVDRRPIQEAVASLGLPCELPFEAVRRGGFRATYAKVVTPNEHAHRHWHHIESIIDKSILSPRQSDLAKRIFMKLGEAEARVHGVDLAKIHFHEVGAVDSIVDIVGSAVGLDLLGVERFESSPVPPGRGWVNSAHGRMPLPAPATAEILRGVPLAESMVDGEMTTPTGAAILATVVERFTSFPALTIESIGLGAGTRDVPDQANIVRLFVGTVNLPAASDRVWVLETNLDDLPGEVVGYTMNRLMDGGALDAFVTPIQMKKNRPGVMVSVLCDEAKIPALEDLLFRETATLGIRRYPVSRHKLKRQSIEVESQFGLIKGKLGWLGERPPTFSPEFEDCARIAAARAIPLREVYDAAHAAFHTSREGLERCLPNPGKS
jgi:pyridinium-3,5-bisthiocarboxylic acid mononucleotide nickel chelatase